MSRPGKERFDCNMYNNDIELPTLHREFCNCPMLSGPNDIILFCVHYTF